MKKVKQKSNTFEKHFYVNCTILKKNQNTRYVYYTFKINQTADKDTDISGSIHIRPDSKNINIIQVMHKN